MENREQQILSEIKGLMSSIRIQLEQLDVKMAELQQVVDPDDVSAMPIDLEILENEVDSVQEDVLVEDDLPFVEDSVTEEVELEEPVDEELVVEEPVVEEVAVEETEAQVQEEVVEEDPVVEGVAEVEEIEVVEAVEEMMTEDDDDDDLPLFAEPKPLFEAAIESPKAKKTVIDVMTDKEAWRTDMVGTPVRDLLSAISLNDRVQFINVLFKGDPVLFQQTRAKINAMTSLDEVVGYLTSTFDWDMGSQVVYRFMMAVRRKVQA
jgi:hypothetical protein